MKRGRSYSEEIRDIAVQRYIAGESARDIATSLGPCKSTIMQWVHECGQSRRQGARRRTVDSATPCLRATATQGAARMDGRWGRDRGDHTMKRRKGTMRFSEMNADQARVERLRRVEAVARALRGVGDHEARRILAAALLVSDHYFTEATRVMGMS